MIALQNPLVLSSLLGFLDLEKALLFVKGQLVALAKDFVQVIGKICVETPQKRQLGRGLNLG